MKIPHAPNIYPRKLSAVIRLPKKPVPPPPVTPPIDEVYANFVANASKQRMAK